MQVYSLISSLKTYHRLFTFYPLVTEPFHPCAISTPQTAWPTVLQPLRRIELMVHIAIPVLPGTHFHLSQVKRLRVTCLAQGHNILTMSPRLRGEEHDTSPKILHQAGFETTRQEATSAERHALTIAPCPSLYRQYINVIVHVFQFQLMLLTCRKSTIDSRLFNRVLKGLTQAKIIKIR